MRQWDDCQTHNRQARLQWWAHNLAYHCGSHHQPAMQQELVPLASIELLRHSQGHRQYKSKSPPCSKSDFVQQMSCIKIFNLLVFKVEKAQTLELQIWPQTWKCHCQWWELHWQDQTHSWGPTLLRPHQVPINMNQNSSILEFRATYFMYNQSECS